MRGLSPSRAKLTMRFHFDAVEKAALAGVGERLGELTRATGGISGCTFPATEGRTDEQQKCDKRGHGIARQPEKKILTETSKNEGLAGTHGDFPKLQFPAELLESGFDKIQFTDRDAAGSDEDVGL